MIPGLVSNDQISSILGALFVSSLFCEMLMADAFPDEHPFATAVASSDTCKSDKELTSVVNRPRHSMFRKCLNHRLGPAAGLCISLHQ